MKGTRELADFSYLGDPRLKLPKPLWPAPSERCQDGRSRCRAVRRLLVGLAVLSAGTAVAQGQVDPKIAEFCMKAQDFAGCVQTMTGGLPPKQKMDAEEGLRTWTRESGVVVRMRVASVVAMKSAGNQYGSHIKWVYGRTGTNNEGWQKEVQADCKNYTADWNEDRTGWLDVKDPEKYRRDSGTYEPVREAKAVMDEFCPQIERLISEAQAVDKKQ